MLLNENNIKKPIKKILIIAHHNKKNSQETAKLMEEALKELFEINIWVYNPECIFPKKYNDIDLAILLGGDGLVLGISRLLVHLHIPLLPFNTGTLGFLAENLPKNLDRVKEVLWYQTYTQHFRNMIRVEINRNGVILKNFLALNEGVVKSVDIAHMFHTDVFISDNYLGLYKADGLLVATATGSTAYSLSAGGPIMHPASNTILFTPICPHSLSNRPIVIPSSEFIRFIIPKQRSSKFTLAVDGQIFTDLQERDMIQFRLAEEKINIISLEKYNFYAIIKSKLN